MVQSPRSNNKKTITLRPIERIDNFIRITIGTEKEMEIFEEKIKEILKQNK